MLNPNLDKKISPDYYQRFRIWPSLFNIKPNSHVLDIGCGTGLLGNFIKENYNCWVEGIEILEEYQKISSRILDKSYCADIESFNTLKIKNKFEYIIFSDSLEHLLNPDEVLIKIQSLLSENGKLLLSVPNVRNFRVTFPLIFKGQWEYQEEGLLDKTHLRFFTISSLINLLNKSGYQVNQIHLDLPVKSKSGLLNLLTFGIFKNHLTSHYFVEACLIKY